MQNKDKPKPMHSEFFLPMHPPTTTHQQKAIRVVNGKPILYEPERVRAARAKLSAHLSTHAPQSPYTGALRLVTKWCFPIRGKHTSGEYKTSRPDTDNLQKLLKDVMTDLAFWQDDAQVASEIIEKFWAEPPGLYIAISALPGAEEIQSTDHSPAADHSPGTEGIP